MTRTLHAFRDVPTLDVKMRLSGLEPFVAG